MEINPQEIKPQNLDQQSKEDEMEKIIDVVTSEITPEVKTKY